MTKIRLLALLTVVILAVALIPAVVTAQPVPPCRIHGTAMVDGVNVADGTVITATIDGDTYTATTPSAYGASTYLVQIAQPDGKSYAGKQVTFMIGADTASETATWTQGGNITLDLHKGALPATPPPGGFKDVTAKPLPAGSAPTAEILSDGTLELGIPAGEPGADGAKGDTGPTGPAGMPGEDGDDASAALGIVALILAIVALVAVGVLFFMKRKTA